MSAALYERASKARIEELTAIVGDLRAPKSVRQEALSEIRSIERELGLDIVYPKGYNKS